MPAGITLPQFDRMEWHQWAGILEALLTLHKAEDMFDFSTHPNQVSNKEWSLVQRRTKAYLCLYVKQDIYSLIASDIDFPTFKHKFDRLKATYGSASGSTTIFNLWIQLTQAQLDESTPMAAQLAKLNEARISLANTSMGVTDVQSCLILLHALPASYEVVASTILASSDPTTLSHTDIIVQIINEEGRWASSGSLLNAARATLIKSSGRKKGKTDHSSLTHQ